MQRSEAIDPRPRPTYCVVVKLDDLGRLERVCRLPDRGAAPGTGSRSEDPRTALALGRLGHVQTRLDELRGILASESLGDRRYAWRVQFSVEDILMNMKLAMDELLHVDHGGHAADPWSVMVGRDAAGAQTESPLSGVAAEEYRGAPLADVLDGLVGTRPRSVGIQIHYKGATGSLAGSQARALVDLGDLLSSFHEWVKAVLGTCRRGASQGDR